MAKATFLFLPDASSIIAATLSQVPGKTVERIATT